jgi:hypothetical protein
MSASPHVCAACGAAIDPDDRSCRVGGAPTAWRSWPAPTASGTRPDLQDADAPDFIPLVLSPKPERPRIARICLALIVTVSSVALWILSEVLLRDGHDRLRWGAVWFASGGATIVATVLWGKWGVPRLRRWARHRAHSG